MDADLDTYYLARKLHLVPQLLHIFASNALTTPLLFRALDPRARREAEVLLRVLWRVFSRHAHAPDDDRRINHMSLMVLSYISFPELVSPITATPALRVAEVLSRGGTPIISSSSPTTTNHLISTTPVRPPPISLGTNVMMSEVLRGDVHEVQSSPTSPQRHAHVSMEGAHADVPAFYLRPSTMNHHVAGDDRSTNTPHLFVRMAHTELLNEESLNTYFGRYGQISCELVHRQHLSQAEEMLNPAMFHYLAELHRCSPTDLLLQDFIISVDAIENALRAIQRAYYKELIFIAMSDPSKNIYTPQHLNAIMAQDVGVMLLPSAPEMRVEAVAESDRHRRKRARREVAKRRWTAVDAEVDEMEVRTTRGTKRSSSASSSSSRSSSSSSSGSSASSGSSCTDSDSDDEHGAFVPDVVVDGLPYFITEDQLKVLVLDYGHAHKMHLSVDDVSGAFTGTVLIGMSSLDEAVDLANGLHGKVYEGSTLCSGVLERNLSITSILDGEVRRRCEEELPPHFNVLANERLWV